MCYRIGREGAVVAGLRLGCRRDSIAVPNVDFDAPATTRQHLIKDS